MRDKSEVTELVNGLYKVSMENLKKVAEINHDKTQDILSKDEEDIGKIVGEVLQSVKNICEGVNYKGVYYPQFTIRYSEVKTNIYKLIIVVSSKIKTKYRFREQFDIVVTDNVLMDIGEKVVSNLCQFLYLAEAENNLVALNEKIEKIVYDYKLPYTFSFKCDRYSTALVLEIDDKHVVFNAIVSNALDIPNLPIFNKGTEYNDLIANTAYKELVESLLPVQTTVQLIKAKIKLKDIMTGIKTKKRASKLIRESYHKNAKNLSTQKSGIFYYNADVEIDDETVNIFSLIEKTEDGLVTIVLAPFDTATLLNVDYDVLSEVF